MRTILVVNSSDRARDEAMGRWFSRMAGLPTKVNRTNHTMEVCGELKFVFTIKAEGIQRIRGLMLDVAIVDEAWPLPEEMRQYIKSHTKEK
jgi:hypothetical protein